MKCSRYIGFVFANRSSIRHINFFYQDVWKITLQIETERSGACYLGLKPRGVGLGSRVGAQYLGLKPRGVGLGSRVGLFFLFLRGNRNEESDFFFYFYRYFFQDRVGLFFIAILFFLFFFSHVFVRSVFFIGQFWLFSSGFFALFSGSDIFSALFHPVFLSDKHSFFFARFFYGQWKHLLFFKQQRYVYMCIYMYVYIQ